jgi:toxin YoeB
MPEAEKDYAHWQKYNQAYVRKIDELLVAMEEDPRAGRGNPHPLRGNLHGFWSQSFSKKHRILYKIRDNIVLVHRFYGHYE